MGGARGCLGAVSGCGDTALASRARYRLLEFACGVRGRSRLEGAARGRARGRWECGGARWGAVGGARGCLGAVSGCGSAVLAARV